MLLILQVLRDLLLRPFVGLFCDARFSFCDRLARFHHILPPMHCNVSPGIDPAPTL